MSGHPRDQATVSLHDRWPLVRGMERRSGGHRQNVIGGGGATLCTTTLCIITSDIHTEYNVMHCLNYVGLSYSY